MRLYLNEGNVFTVNDDLILEILNVKDFISSLKGAVPGNVGHLIAKLNYKLICGSDEYNGEVVFDSYKVIRTHCLDNNIDEKSPYKVEFVDWRLSDKDDKYFDVNIFKR